MRLSVELQGEAAGCTKREGIMIPRLASAWRGVSCLFLTHINATAGDVKYLDEPMGVIVAIEARALEYVLRWAKLLPETRVIVFSFLEQTAPARLNDQSEGAS